MELARLVAHDFLLLFAMVNAVGNLPIVAELTDGMKKRERNRTYRVAALTGAAVVVGFAVLGDWLLDLVFRIQTAQFQVAGGILVFGVAARGMILGPRQAFGITADDRRGIGVFPLGFPLLAGPGTILTTILLMRHDGRLPTVLAAALVYVAVLPVLHLGPWVTRAVGRVGTLVVSRLLYIMIAAKAVSYVLDGLRETVAAW